MDYWTPSPSKIVVDRCLESSYENMIEQGDNTQELVKRLEAVRERLKVYREGMNDYDVV